MPFDKSNTMYFFRRQAMIVAATVVSLSNAGCGGAPDDMPDLADATGTIMMDGKPLAEASVSFSPTNGNRGASGRTDAEGRFTLSYGAEDGCPLGEHTVSVSTREMLLDEYGGVKGMKDESIPVRYNNRTELKATVNPDSSENDFVFQLESGGKVQ